MLRLRLCAGAPRTLCAGSIARHHILGRLVVCFAACGTILCASAATTPQTVSPSPAPQFEKVEPPSWWAGHTINPVRLLIRGVALHGARITSITPSITRVCSPGVTV